jgi:hypothetical protein
LGLIAGLGVIVIMYYPHLGKHTDTERFGFLFIITGINILLYLPIMKMKVLKKASE